jgi:hypothetical protein
VAQTELPNAAPRKRGFVQKPSMATEEWCRKLKDFCLGGRITNEETRLRAFGGVSYRSWFATLKPDYFFSSL